MDRANKCKKLKEKLELGMHYVLDFFPPSQTQGIAEGRQVINNTLIVLLDCNALAFI